MGFIAKAKALIGRGDRGAAGAGADDGNEHTDDQAGERTPTSDDLLDKAKAAIDKLLE